VTLGLFLLALLLGINALYVAAEFAFVGLGRTRAARIAQIEGPAARLVEAIAGDPRRLDQVIAACQIGITASSLALGALVQIAFAEPLGRLLGDLLRLEPRAAMSAGITVALLAATGLQVVLSEQIPKAVALRHPERWALNLAIPLRLSEIVFAGVIPLLNGAANAALRLLRIPAAPHGHLHSPTEIGWVVAESARAGALRGELGDRLHDALRFATCTAGDVMVPRVRIRGVPETIALAELRHLLWESDHTRLPVYRGTLDEIIGVIHAKDVALKTTGVADPPPLSALIRPIPCVPWTVRAAVLLERMRAEHAGMAVLLDEHGGTAGIVTFEDLVEEILGEVEDEFDPSGPTLGRLEDGRVRLRGGDAIGWANIRFGLHLESAGSRTVGGLVMEQLGRLARVGDRVETGGARLLVEAATGPRIDLVLVEPTVPPAAPLPGGGR